MRAYVVGYAPADERGGTGGFAWFPTADEAIRIAKRGLRELGGLGSHSLTFVPLDVPDDVAYPGGQSVADRDAVTAWIDANLHLVEVGLAGEQSVSLLREGMALGRAIDERRQTRPSAILRRPDPETPVSEATTAELLFEARERIHARRWADEPLDRPLEQRAARARDLERAEDATEDAISLHNRAVYRERGIFAITDAERTPDGTE